MSRMGPMIRKRDDHPGATGLEALGLTWLAEAMADGGAHVVPVVRGTGWIEEPRLTAVPATASAAEAFGRALAVTHAAGAPAFGVAPPGWDGRTRMGRSDVRIRPCAPEPEGTAPRRWGEFFADDRLVPYLRPCRDRGALSAGGVAVLERVCERLRAGDYDSEQPALVRRAARERGDRVAVARTHGDLWNGNVMWVPRSETLAWAPSRAGRGPLDDDTGGATTIRGAGGPGPQHGDVVGVLIDPLAQGAHAETDLAALGVFGQRHLERIIAGYDEVSPLADGWRERVGLHRLHMLIIHALLFGGPYGAETASTARRYA
ncbi:fructosamine kinase family protein [uncultured Propionibacterium sp.]|uniref:fructosamine kinase family protein n=1 Tax=uncultured Propionibacterium sp. TaxID=218066 RepID=UPI00293137DD|nr:fructosamine kinase family protein [uncultured Propionibacterium sp.]